MWYLRVNFEDHTDTLSHDDREYIMMMYSSLKGLVYDGAPVESILVFHENDKIVENMQPRFR